MTSSIFFSRTKNIFVNFSHIGAQISRNEWEKMYGEKKSNNENKEKKDYKNLYIIPYIYYSSSTTLPTRITK